MSKGLMAVYDITSRKSFELIKVVINNLREMKKEIKIILVGNKCDLKSMREVSYEEALAYPEVEWFAFIETSAFLSINIDEAFNLLVKEIIRNEKELQSSINIKPADANKNSQSRCH